MAHAFRLSVITTCKGRLSHLQRMLPTVARHPECQVIVVDYSCPDHSGDWVAQHFENVLVQRVEGETHFNLSRARNLGAAMARAPHLCFLDVDNPVSPEFFDTLLPRLGEDRYLIPDSVSRAGVILCPRAAFERSGGYDEHYRGWGDEDIDLRESLGFLGLTEEQFPHQLVDHLDHPDELRTQFYAIRDRQQSWTINRTYRLIKFDVMRLYGGFLPASARAAIFEQVTRAVSQATETGAPVHLEIPLGARFLSFSSHSDQPHTSRGVAGCEVQHSLSYTLQSAERTLNPAASDAAQDHA